MKFNYKITNINYVESKVTIKYWCEGMTSYNGFSETLDFDIEKIKDITEDEFDMRVYEYVKVKFNELLFKYENYKSGKYDIIENVAKSARSIDVL
tara:strand:- start:363 stop:647 length:285 start_codon:yes stop_codon:yes gene_type:complete